MFPAAVTTAELLGTIGNPFGTAGSTAYSQYGSLPLLQLVSVTGIWGLTFLISWLAPVVNQLWERGWSGSAVRAPAVLLVAAITAALLFGGARLAFAAPAAETVRVAALAPDRQLSDLAYSAPDLRSGEPGRTRPARDEHFAPVLDDLFAQVRAGGPRRRQDHRVVGGGGPYAGGGPGERGRREPQTWPASTVSTCRCR